MWAVVPVKSLTAGKARLAGVLMPRQRHELVVQMLQDVLAALSAAPGLDGVLVVSNDVDVRALSAGFGARWLPETASNGLCAALRQAASVLATEQIAGMMIVPADVPLITPAAVARVVQAHRHTPAVTLVAAADGGTNALAMSPPELIAPAFGDNSYDRHRASASERGVVPVSLDVPEFALDIDTLDNLLTLLRLPATTRTQQYLCASGLAAQLLARQPSLMSAPHPQEPTPNQSPHRGMHQGHAG